MKKILLALTLCFSVFAFSNVNYISSKNPTTHITPKTDSVYICNSTTAYAYHSTSDCKGLNNCTHGVIKVSLSDATNKYGRRPCKICE